MIRASAPYTSGWGIFVLLKMDRVRIARGGSLSTLHRIYIYRSGTVNSNTVNSKFHLLRSYYEIFFYHFSNISCLKCTVNSNFHLIRSKTLPTNDFELTVPNLYWKLTLLCDCSFKPFIRNKWVSINPSIYFIFLGGHKSFLWDHWYHYFGLLMTSLGFKARTGSLILFWWRCTWHTMFPGIQIWLDTFASVFGQHNSQLPSPHACFSRDRLPDSNQRLPT